MRVFMTTVAGTASRFNRDLDRPAVKSIYYQESPRETLLYQLISKAKDCDRILIVGGYEYEKLTAYADRYLTDFSNKIEIIYNPRFKDYGSGYSLYLGVKAAEKYHPDEIVFAEGDLYYSGGDFQRIIEAKTDVLTVITAPIQANKSVVAYVDSKGCIKYLYDTAHKALQIDEPFQAVYNSGQVWKFTDPSRLYRVANSLSDEQMRATNLEIIGGYFSDITCDEIEIITMRTWINCNTVADYEQMIEQMRRDEK